MRVYYVKMINVSFKCQRTRILEVYRAVNGTALSYIQELFEVKGTPYYIRDPSRTSIPKANSTAYGLKSL